MRIHAQRDNKCVKMPESPEMPKCVAHQAEEKVTDAIKDELRPRICVQTRSTMQAHGLLQVIQLFKSHFNAHPQWGEINVLIESKPESAEIW